MRCAPAAFALVLLLVMPAPSLQGQNGDATFDRLAGFVSEQMKEHGVPGVSIGILHKGALTTRGFGVTNVDHPLPVNDDTVFQVGSISKTFTGTAIMRLVEQGRIRLDAPVRTYIPEFAVRDAEASSKATVMDLLTHVGGWEGDIFDDTGDGTDAVATYVARLKDAEQVAPLGSVWSYNNAGFIVAGRIVEVVTGKAFEAALQELVMTPLGLENTYLTPADVMTLRFAVGHNSSPKGPQVARPWPIGRYAHSAGGVISTARDLLTYAQFQLGATAPGVLADDTRRRMQTPVLTKHGTDEQMAVTWHINNAGGLRRVSHGGATVGQQALLTMAPEQGFAVVVLTNASAGSRVNQAVTRWAFKEYLGVDERDPEPSPTQPALAEYAARYSRPFADVVVTAEKGTLQLQAIPKRGFPNASAPVPPPGPQVTYAFYAKDRAIATSGPQKGARIDFIRNGEAGIGWVRVGGRIHRKAGATS